MYHCTALAPWEHRDTRDELRLGFIGTTAAIEHTRSMLTEFTEGVDGDDAHHPFPGFASDVGYRSRFVTDDALIETITAA